MTFQATWISKQKKTQIAQKQFYRVNIDALDAQVIASLAVTFHTEAAVVEDTVSWNSIDEDNVNAKNICLSSNLHLQRRRQEKVGN